MLSRLSGPTGRSLAIAAGALLLSTTLSSCGFDAATNRVNTISSGINDQSGEVDVLGAVIISGAPDTGVLVGSLANADPEQTVSLTRVSGAVTSAGTLDPVEIGPRDLVSLFQTGGVPLSGVFELGDFVGIELTFDNGQTSSLEIPVVRPCYEYDPAKFPGLTIPTAPADPDATAAATEPPERRAAEPAESAEGTESSEATDPYSCTPIQSEVHGEEE